MRKIIRLLVAAALTISGLIIGTRPASASAPTYCTEEWYFHAPYPIGGGIWAWATCAPNGTQPSIPQDSVTLPGAGMLVGIDMIELRISTDGGHNYSVIGVNYMAGGTFHPWADTSYAVAGGCVSGAFYISRFHYYRPDVGTWNYVNSGPIQRC